MDRIEKLKQSLNKYLYSIKNKYDTSLITEHSLRTDLENLLNAIKPKEIKILQEASKEKYELGTPDFKVFKQIDSEEKLSYPNLIGYIECKKLNDDLDKVIKSTQIKKYLEVSPNILLTDYNRFILLSFEKKIADIKLFEFGLEDNLFSDLDNITEEKIKQIEFILNKFFNSTERKIKSKRELVKVLSTQAFYLGVKTREFIENKNNQYQRFIKFFTKTYETFKEAINYEFDLKEFCDIFGQSIVYGLLVAHLEIRDKTNEKKLDESNDFVNFIPKEFMLLAEFLYFSAPLFNIPDIVQYTIENIKKTIVLIDQEKIAKELNTNIDGISIYLYEDFLKEFDKLRGSEKRKENGVYYTPDSVVNFIVKSIHKMLKIKLNQQKGFSSNNVKTLDFATGTGSFLAKVFETIIEEEKSPVFKIDNIKNKFLKDVYGFEMMFVPYIVAHLKLSQILKNEGFNFFDDNNKLQIFLTNTLDLEHRGLRMSMPLLLLEEEYEKANKIKNKEDILVILGNPPYNNKSKNKGEKIVKLLDEYKKGLNETKINLDDDYIKFIRFAEWKLIDQWNNGLIPANRQGIMGFITNNSFLWGRTHRQMRKSLYENFDEIYILNLHGGKTDKKDDKNIFDIQVGVCISIFIKYENPTIKKVYYYSTQDNNILSRQDKFNFLNNNLFDTINWKELKIKEPYYWFIDKDLSSKEYEKSNDFWRIDEIFKHINSGIQTKRDNITIHFTEKNLRLVIDDFKNLDKEDISIKYKVKDSRDWSIEKSKESLKNFINANIISYRPFDSRYTFLNNKSKGFIAYPRYETSKHFLQENIGLVFTKSLTSSYFAHSFIVNNITECGILSSQTSEFSFVAPLYLYNEDIDSKISKEVNFTNKFKEYILSKPYSDSTPEEILGYIYAILYTPNYRERYYEYLKINYPKIPFTNDLDKFNKLSKIGLELIDLHLMKTIPDDKEIFLDFIDKSMSLDDNSYIIKKLSSKQRYKDNTIFLNDTLCIRGVTNDIWNYIIGGYKVIDKWIKYRIDYRCSRDELEHLVNICKIIKQTLYIQKQLKDYYGK